MMKMVRHLLFVAWVGIPAVAGAQENATVQAAQRAYDELDFALAIVVAHTSLVE